MSWTARLQVQDVVSSGGQMILTASADARDSVTTRYTDSWTLDGEPIWEERTEPAITTNSPSPRLGNLNLRLRLEEDSLPFESGDELIVTISHSRTKESGGS